MTRNRIRLGRAHWCASLSFVVAVAAAIRLTSPGKPGAGSEARFVRLSPVRQVVLPAGRGGHAVGIRVSDPEEGWGGPQDAIIDEQGRIIIADTENCRLLMVDRSGRIQAKRLPSRFHPYLVTPAEPGWVAVVGYVGQLQPLRLIRYALDSPAYKPGRSAILNLPRDWSVKALASDDRGTVYVSGENQMGPRSVVARISAGTQRVVKMYLRGIDEQGRSQVVRGYDGFVYLFLVEARRWWKSGVLFFTPKDRTPMLVRLDAQGKPVKRWDFADVEDIEGVVGIDREGRVYRSSAISGWYTELASPPPEAWGYYVYCYALGDSRPQLLDKAEIGYSKGDMEANPDFVYLGESRLRLSPDGSIMLRTATRRRFKLEFFPPPPWRRVPQSEGMHMVPRVRLMS